MTGSPSPIGHHDGPDRGFGQVRTEISIPQRERETHEALVPGRSALAAAVVIGAALTSPTPVCASTASADSGTSPASSPMISSKSFASRKSL